MKSIDRYEKNIGLSVLYIALMCLGVYLTNWLDILYDKPGEYKPGEHLYIELEGVKTYPITVDPTTAHNLAGNVQNSLASIDVKAGDKITVLMDGVHRVSSMSAPKKMALGIPIDINSASITELDALPGIGPVLAERIVRYRESAVVFGSVEELMNVRGVGIKKYGALKGYVIVE
ncbi:MAG: helix-hairpin-helix domain-containing protein [Candidatus Dadabacteria bacterium]|nr:helix-hairpin-helix domain-containing protein [Candidatus Dadabacteria bacterium]